MDKFRPAIRMAKPNYKKMRDKNDSWIRIAISTIKHKQFIYIGMETVDLTADALEIRYGSQSSQKFT